jgi:integrase
MGVKVRSSKGKLFLDINWKGRRWWEATHLDAGVKKFDQLAEKMRIDRLYELVCLDKGYADEELGRSPLISFAARFAKGRDKSDPLKKSLKYLEKYAGRITLGNLTEQWVKGYIAFLEKQGVLGDATVAKYFDALVTILNDAVNRGYIQRSPAAMVKRPKVEEKPIIYLTLQEIKRIADVEAGGELGKDVKAAFLFACFTGLRISDLKSLTWNDVDLDNQRMVKNQVKTKQLVTMKLSHAALAQLEQMQRRSGEGTDFVFPRLATTKTNTNQYLNSYAKKVGIEKQIGWHTARHSFAVLLLEAGENVHTVSKLLGHKMIKTTMHYAQITDKMKDEAVQKLSWYVELGE